MIPILPDELIEGLANKFLATKHMREVTAIKYGYMDTLTFEQYVTIHIRDTKIGKSEKAGSN